MLVSEKVHLGLARAFTHSVFGQALITGLEVDLALC